MGEARNDIMDGVLASTIFELDLVFLEACHTILRYFEVLEKQRSCLCNPA
jgi:hypothetical protein